MTIQNFKEIRRDGKVFDETMSLDDILAFGWPPEKIMELQWNYGSQLVSFKVRYGVLGKVICDREAVAVIIDTDESGRSATLSVLNADGSQRFQVSNTQNLRGKNETGQFCGFENARAASPHNFGAIFEKSSDNEMFQLDIDATNGNIVATYALR